MGGNNMIQRTDFRRESTSFGSEPSIGTLLKELTDESRTLLRQEVELAKVEMSEKAAVMGRNGAYMGAGAFVAYAGLLAIIAAACIGTYVLLRNAMDSEIAAWLAPLIVGVIVAAVGYIFVQKAINTFKRESLMP